MDQTLTNPEKLAPSEILNDEDMEDFSATSKKRKADVLKKAQNFRNYAGEKAAAIKQEAGAKIKEGAEKAKEYHASAEDYIKENPTKAVLGAVGLGVIIGLILRR